MRSTSVWAMANRAPPCDSLVDGVADVFGEPLVPPLFEGGELREPPEDCIASGLGAVEAAPVVAISAPMSVLRCVTTPLNGARTFSYSWREMIRSRLAR